MQYTKTKWENYPSIKTPLTAKNLNNIEDGIEALVNVINALGTIPTKTSDLVNDGSDGTSQFVEVDQIPTRTSELINDGEGDSDDEFLTPQTVRNYVINDSYSSSGFTYSSNKIEELIDQGGGGGDVIDDTVVSTDKTYSSSKILSLLDSDYTKLEPSYNFNTITYFSNPTSYAGQAIAVIGDSDDPIPASTWKAGDSGDLTVVKFNTIKESSTLPDGIIGKELKYLEFNGNKYEANDCDREILDFIMHYPNGMPESYKENYQILIKKRFDLTDNYLYFVMEYYKNNNTFLITTFVIDDEFTVNTKENLIDPNSIGYTKGSYEFKLYFEDPTIPLCDKTEDGVYILKATVSNSKVTYSWESYNS